MISIKYPDDLGIPREPHELSARCAELAGRLVRQGAALAAAPSPEWVKFYDARIKELEADLWSVRSAYNELIMAVGQKHPGETRHQTALRYIEQAERPTEAAESPQAAGRTPQSPGAGPERT